jgi:hypothetical protein
MTSTTELAPRVGDTIELYGEQVGAIARRGQVLEVIGEGGQQRFRVCWEDGHTTIVYPSSDGIVLRATSVTRPTS